MISPVGIYTQLYNIIYVYRMNTKNPKYHVIPFFLLLLCITHCRLQTKIRINDSIPRFGIAFLPIGPWTISARI